MTGCRYYDKYFLSPTLTEIGCSIIRNSLFVQIELLQLACVRTDKVLSLD